MKRPHEQDRPVFDHIDLILAGMAILIALLALTYSIGQYQHLFGHKPY